MIASYSRQAAELERVIASIPPALVGRRPAEGRWSVLEIVCHLADAELLAAARIRRIITQDRPRLWGYQQEKWAAALEYDQRRVSVVQARFALLRYENAELIKGLAEEVWRQTAEHDLYGTLSLEQLIEDYLTHTAKHLDQIAQVAAELGPPIRRSEGAFMAKTEAQSKDTSKAMKGKNGKESKEAKAKESKVLKGVKKAIKKSRRKLSEEKFERELQRTITFLEEVRQRITHAPAAGVTNADGTNQANGKEGGKEDKASPGKGSVSEQAITAAEAVEVEAAIGA